MGLLGIGALIAALAAGLMLPEPWVGWLRVALGLLALGGAVLVFRHRRAREHRLRRLH